METNKFTINYKSGESPILNGLGDLHVGNSNADLEFFKRRIGEISKQDVYVIGMGDWCDAIVPSDSRFNIDTVDSEYLNGNLILKQYDFVLKQLDRIQDKIIGLHTGNHDSKIKKTMYTDYVQYMCDELEVPYLKWSALTKLQFVRSGRSASYTIYSTHGNWGGGLKGNKVNRIESLDASYDADIYMVGHSHDLFATYTLQPYLNQNGNIGEKLKLHVNTGCFLRGIVEGNDSYAEEGNMKPNRVGYV